MSIFEKLFGEKTIDVINRDTKLSTTDITNFIKNDSGNMRNPINSATQSNANRPLDPIHSGHPVRY